MPMLMDVSKQRDGHLNMSSYEYNVINSMVVVSCVCHHGLWYFGSAIWIVTLNISLFNFSRDILIVSFRVGHLVLTCYVISASILCYVICVFTFWLYILGVP